MLKKELSTFYSQKRKGLIIEGLLTVASASDDGTIYGYYKDNHGDFSGDKNILYEFYTYLYPFNGDKKPYLGCKINLPEEVVGDGSTGFCFGAEIVSEVYTGKCFFVPYWFVHEGGTSISYPGTDRKYCFVFDVPNKLVLKEKESESYKEIRLSFPCESVVYNNVNPLYSELKRDDTTEFISVADVAVGEPLENQLTKGTKTYVSLFVDLSNMQTVEERMLMGGGKHLAFRAANRSLFKEAA